MKFNRTLFFILASLALLFASCDAAYDLNFIVNNTSSDTIPLHYIKRGFGDTTILIMPNERKTFLADYVIGPPASKFGNCCPCEFDLIGVSDSSLHITDADKWIVEKDNGGKKDKVGYVNCIFTK